MELWLDSCEALSLSGLAKPRCRMCSSMTVGKELCLLCPSGGGDFIAPLVETDRGRSCQ